MNGDNWNKKSPIIIIWSHSLCKQCLQDLQFMKKGSSSPNLSKLARDVSLWKQDPCAELFTQWMKFSKNFLFQFFQFFRFNTLALAFDVENDWNYKNRNQIAQGRWQASSSSSSRGGSNNSSSDASFTKVRSGSCDYGWLCDLINRYGEGERRFFFI